jgi:DNA-binding winged helix-turn-helix (wHTH) protein
MAELKRPPIRFGIFEVDLQAGELRRQGVKVKLQQQPFEILAMLLECPGEVLTREELQKRLWPTDTFVDFERGLNRATNRLRDSLGDEADNPRFIETLPRRGYRFIGQIEKLDGSRNTAELVSGQTTRCLQIEAVICRVSVGRDRESDLLSRSLAWGCWPLQHGSSCARGTQSNRWQSSLS